MQVRRGDRKRRGNWRKDNGGRGNWGKNLELEVIKKCNLEEKTGMVQLPPQ